MDVGTRTWRDGPAMPASLRQASIWQREDTFLMFGGVEDSLGADSILEFDSINESWITREEKMERGKYFMFLVGVDSDLMCFSLK